MVSKDSAISHSVVVTGIDIGYSSSSGDKTALLRGLSAGSCQQVFLKGRSRCFQRQTSHAAILGTIVYKPIDLLQTEILLDRRNACFCNRPR